jgi:hypothetical protein
MNLPNHKELSIYLDFSEIGSCDNSIELTKEQVKVALSSLILNHQENRTVASRKRRRNKSIENPPKKSKQIYNDIIVSNTKQPETIVLATSGLNQQQMVRFYVLLFE